MITEALFEETLLKPVLLNGARELIIVSGYATPAMVNYHLEQVTKEIDDAEIKINMIVGMTVRDGIPKITHSGFMGLVSDSFVCRYVVEGTPVHTKAYAWKDSDSAFIGSANYTQTAFLGRSREALTGVSPEAVADYYDSLLEDTLPCNHPDILDKIKLTKRGIRPELASPPEEDIIEPDTTAINTEGMEHVTISLLDRNGNMPGRSGLNWGQRQGRDHDQAYLSIRRGECPTGFFPFRYRHLTIMTDDGVTFYAHIAQETDRFDPQTGQEYGKAIHTPDNTELGRYFRRRLSVPYGAMVEVEHLTAYGRTDVDFYKIDDETFYMDFSVSV